MCILSNEGDLVTVKLLHALQGRAPEGYQLLLSFIRGSQDPVAATLAQSQLIEIADRDLREIMLKSDAPAPEVRHAGSCCSVATISCLDRCFCCCRCCRWLR